MITWHSEGILLSTKPHGETAAIICALTEEHGRHTGLVHGGRSRRIAPILQPGAQLDLEWRARLEEHMGTFRVELIKSRAARIMSDKLKLAGLNAIVSLLAFALPERESHLKLYRSTERLLDQLGQGENWLQAYLHWELILLAETGFGLNLATCAVTGRSDDLHYVSPKTGRAVSSQAAGKWAARLLPFPDSLKPNAGDSNAEITQALAVTGHFLTSKLAPALGNNRLPEARTRFLRLLNTTVSRQ